MAPKKKVQKSNSSHEDINEDMKDQLFETFSSYTGINKETVVSYILNQDSVTYLLGGVSFLAAPLGKSSDSGYS